MPLCLASWPSSSLAQALQQPHAEQPDSPDPQPQILVGAITDREMVNNLARNVVKKTPSSFCVFLPSWYSVGPSTADTAGTVASAVSTHCADHALVQLPLVHAWLTHHALLFLLFQLVLQVFIHGCGHALYTKCYKKNTQTGKPSDGAQHKDNVRQNIQYVVMCICSSICSPFPAWLMAPVSLPHWPLLFTPNVHTSPLLVRTHVWALPMATWVTKWPFRSVTWPVEKKVAIMMKVNNMASNREIFIDKYMFILKKSLICLYQSDVDKDKKLLKYLSKIPWSWEFEIALSQLTHRCCHCK